MIKHARSAWWLFASLLPLTAAGYGCSGTTDVRTPTTAEARGTLQQAQSCADLEQMLKQDAIAKMNAQIDAIIAEIEANGGYWGYPDYGWEDGGSVSVGSGGEVPPSPAPGTGGSGGSTGGSGTGGASNGGGDGTGTPPEHSETNTQVAGVDEADILKTDGNYIYLLHGQSLQVLKSFPASDLAINTTTEIEGNPIEMFVTDDQLVIYSQVDGTQLYTDAGVEPRSPYYDYYGGGVAYDGYYNPYYAPLTKITVLGLDAGQTTGVQKEVYFEGNYASSRRVAKHVRTVLSGGQHGPALSYYPDLGDSNPQTVAEWTAAFEDLRFKNALAIYGSTLNDWLPYRFEKSNGAVSLIPPSCGSYYVPSQGSTAYGLVQVESFALDNLQAPLAETSIVSAVHTVYSNADSLYLAAQAWKDPGLNWSLPVEAVDTSETFVHKFDLATNPAQPAYVATGAVPGYVKNQFSLDEKDGLLRIATTRQLASQTDWTSSNSVYVLGESEGELVQVGAVTDLAPGEQIYSTRFIGNRGYVVTFRQVDPLFVIDLSTPTAPAVLSELKIPGFSEYMHPIDDNHLLTIGQDATNEGQILGLALQVFDVTNPGAPALMHKYTFSGSESGYSEASYNHKAFNWYGPKNLLAFPFSGWNPNTGEMKSSLELFDVTLDAGIQKRGSIDHTTFFQADPYGYCNGYYGVDVRRGVFIDDYVYAVSYGGVTASHVNSPETLVSSVALAQPAQPYGYCGF
ncbi:beta-propeller domain-containing protein [Polyangium mundeleinium]|uniref:Beta-propeller domain-containing protein n=1 Tax=Polyangium mundeleinium TaxID=2995306 RepID=A0ABT5EH76_9BACT|nr:beta-propeller domain-containing protein [Polyangium mundeleinium]MDC0741111.1 beta-propeller domain-containing protein [Polyangium mundeleinium]